MYANSLEHLLAEIERIDLLIQAQVAQVRRLNGADEQFQGLYISEKELDRLLTQPIGVPRWASGDGQSSQRLVHDLGGFERKIAVRVAESFQRGVRLRLPQLAQHCRLAPFDIDCLLICLAPELDLRYQRIYAYLQDDITKKKPSIDLVLNLLPSSLDAKLAWRQRFSGDAPLLQHRLIELVEDPSQPRPPLLGKYLKVDDRVVAYLLGSDDLDGRIRAYTRKVTPEAQLDRLPSDSNLESKLRGFLEGQTEDSRTILYLQGPYGTGKQSIAEALCRERGSTLLVVEVEHLMAGEDSFQAALCLLYREAILQNGALFFKGLDLLLAEGKKPLLDVFVRAFEQQHGLIFLSGDVAWEPADGSRLASFIRVECPRPPSSRRVRIWSAALNGHPTPTIPLDIQALATKFRFTGGQIQDAVSTAQNLARWRQGDATQITMQDLYEACRWHSNQKLMSLARKINPTYHWGDIVLPSDRLAQLREICNYMKYRDRVYGEWGFDYKLSQGKGLSVLFTGPSGTGKTMGAEIIAGELGLDLYKIDLSTVVSKFIGETEKNLSRIFTEAETSNAILFFDEADALFGKRSEVKDSHDRYANIEIGYLLQRMEEYEGVAILATNFRKNMDEAFVRRLHFTVEFPFPNEEDRRRIWGRIWPEDTPRAPDLDLDFMARRFEITGGNIRNIALAAAFLAADDGQNVSMSHLMRATQREYQKMGKIVAEGQFEQHVSLPLKQKGWESHADRV